jgi:hypothetical protein
MKVKTREDGKTYLATRYGEVSTIKHGKTGKTSDIFVKTPYDGLRPITECDGYKYKCSCCKFINNLNKCLRCCEVNSFGECFGEWEYYETMEEVEKKLQKWKESLEDHKRLVESHTHKIKELEDRLKTGDYRTLKSRKS